MTINNVCDLFDSFTISDTSSQIDTEYYSYTSAIYSDGEVTKNITREGTIHIHKVEGANYIAFIDRDQKTYINIYKYTPEIRYKDIIDNLNKLKKLVGSQSEDRQKLEDELDEIKKRNIQSDDIIDINTFTCTECGSVKNLTYSKSQVGEVIAGVCSDCGTRYTFVPSKYYRIASKKIMYNKSSDTSRNINLETISENPKNSNANIIVPCENKPAQKDIKG